MNSRNIPLNMAVPINTKTIWLIVIFYRYKFSKISPSLPDNSLKECIFAYPFKEIETICRKAVTKN